MEHISTADRMLELAPMTRAELVKELHAVTSLLPRMFGKSRREWSAYRKALVAEVARRSAFNNAQVSA